MPRPLVIPAVMTLTTLADVREFMQHLPAEHRDRATWQYVESQLADAAVGKIEPAEAGAALQIALLLEGVTCRAK